MFEAFTVSWFTMICGWLAMLIGGIVLGEIYGYWRGREEEMKDQMKDQMLTRKEN